MAIYESLAACRDPAPDIARNETPFCEIGLQESVGSVVDLTSGIVEISLSMVLNSVSRLGMKLFWFVILEDFPSLVVHDCQGLDSTYSHSDLGSGVWCYHCLQYQCWDLNLMNVNISSIPWMVLFLLTLVFSAATLTAKRWGPLDQPTAGYLPEGICPSHKCK